MIGQIVRQIEKAKAINDSNSLSYQNLIVKLTKLLNGWNNNESKLAIYNVEKIVDTKNVKMRILAIKIYAVNAIN